MQKSDNSTTHEIQEFEDMAQKLVQIMFCICEKRTQNVPYLAQSPEKTLASAAMTVKEALKTFIEATRL